MLNFSSIVEHSISKFFANLFDNIISYFANVLVDIMSTSQNVLQIPLVVNGIAYAQALAFAILVLKVMNESFQTYILYQNGDPDADPSGIIIRTIQAIAIIACCPWVVRQIFIFGTKVAKDVANLSTGQTGIADFGYMSAAIVGSGGTVIALLSIALVVMMLIVAIQATIRGAELALMAVLGPIMALNLTSNNRSMWSAWFRQVIIICTAQALQIFLLSGAFSLMTNQISSKSSLFLFGWLWVTVKSPKYLQQFAYSTGLTGAVGGTAKQAGTIAVMRTMMKAT